MPGVFVPTWDNCQYGEVYKHRQVLITNMPWLAPLAKDCTGGHEHATIGFGGDLSTADVAAYPLPWRKAYAKHMKEFVQEPVEKCCVHCLPQGDGKLAYARREAVRRCAETVGLDSNVDDFEYDFGEDRGEVYMMAKRSALKAGPRRFGSTHLGARCGCAGGLACAASPAAPHEKFCPFAHPRT